MHYFIVSKVQRTLSEERVAEFFAQYGHVSSFRLKRDARGMSFGYGELRMSECDALLLGASREFVIDDAKVTLYHTTRPIITDNMKEVVAMKAPEAAATPSVTEVVPPRAAPPAIEVAAPQPPLPVALPPPVVHAAAAVSAELYACLPVSHLLVGQLSDPQLLFAQLDPTRLGSLTIVDRTAALCPRTMSKLFCDSFYAHAAERITKDYPFQHPMVAAPLLYGTAGFRTVGDYLWPVAARVVFIAVLRAWKRTLQAGADVANGGCSVGFMVTASHNPPADNGFKLLDPNGGMLDPAWEKWCTEAANAADGATLVQVLQRCIAEEQIDCAAAEKAHAGNRFGVVQIGRDTRPSGVRIVDAVKDMLDTVMHISYTDHGMITTPQMHYIVRNVNLAQPPSQRVVGINEYNQSILHAFEHLMALAASDGGAIRPTTMAEVGRHVGDKRVRLVVDAANGVGCVGMRGLMAWAKRDAASRHLPHDILSTYFDITVLNDCVDDAKLLNVECGAEFAKINAKPSCAMHDCPHVRDEQAHFYCLDGDADRLVAFTTGRDAPSEAAKEVHPPPPRDAPPSEAAGGATWRLIDGDRIAILYALLLRRWLGDDVMAHIDLGLVQTAYANGASTRYAQEVLKIKTYLAATGIKNLHPIAAARDVGIYFEANGHGTALLDPDKCERLLRDAAARHASPQERARLNVVLHDTGNLLSQCCGDAIADMLMCEVALRALNMTPRQWIALYEDRYAQQEKVKVLYPRRIKNTPDETRATDPPGLQDAIDAAVQEAVQACVGQVGAEKGMARAFVRPSGTEPVVRVYAEGTCREPCAALAKRVSDIVTEFCNKSS